MLGNLDYVFRVIVLTALSTSTRISEILGLKARHVDATAGAITIEQRWYRGDVDEPKTSNSRRVLALGSVTEDY